MSEPDLEKGVPFGDLADGGMIAGRVGDDEVLLARKGDELFALDAHCTHYHGPLAEGLIVGDTVRCPWHHACFNLRTGSPERAPAMRPLRVFKTVREGDVVRVLPGGRVETTAATAEEEQHVVIIGAGAAGSFAASELRRIGFGGRVTLLTRESRLPYDRPNLSKDYLAGRAQEDWIPLRSEAEYAEAHVDLRLATVVDRIDAKRSEIHLANGETIAFGALILAPGATPRRLGIPIADGARVHYLRTWEDADAVLASANAARRALVIGASFIGLETAASLRERGLDVTVIGSEDRPLEKVLGREIGDFVRRTHEAHGVRFRLGRRPTEIRTDSVVLDDGSSEPFDLLVAGIGVELDLALAEQAGLTVDRGIVVNELLQTSAENIYAAGDAARFPYEPSGGAIRVEHWVVAGRQGQAAARNAAGRRERFRSIPFFWSQHYDLVFAYVGHAQRADDVQLFGSLDEHNAAAVFRENGRVTAVATLFRDDVSLAVEAAMERGDGDDAILDAVRRAF
ncbi:MAG TPA: FAD-dependent oxidoreductase [Thermoanaerobaculia bacterium]|jgi:NADPH-dependent 2,4-dienoyl-CoA reductase/sulfur reductase-like enzyme/nitrite reductase/ring-hydroxylating ferredoxin subunit|nr:FAD-dependent oxidoreductase [Thermoanaerobaculia bacterium]